MSMLSPIQREALRLAKTGDWLLADAIEVQHRLETDDDFLYGIRVGGRLAYLVFGEHDHDEGEDGDFAQWIETMGGDRIDEKADPDRFDDLLGIGTDFGRAEAAQVTVDYVIGKPERPQQTTLFEQAA